MQARNLLATVGGDASAPDGAQLRLWDPAAILSSSSGAAAAAAAVATAAVEGGAAIAAGLTLTAATSAATVRLFTAKQPPGGSVTAIAATDAAWPQLHLAVGLSGGAIQLMRGDAGNLPHCYVTYKSVTPGAGRCSTLVSC